MKPSLTKTFISVFGMRGYLERASDKVDDKMNDGVLPSFTPAHPSEAEFVVGTRLSC